MQIYTSAKLHIDTNANMLYHVYKLSVQPLDPLNEKQPPTANQKAANRNVKVHKDYIMTFPTSKQIAKVIDLLVFGMEEMPEDPSEMITPVNWKPQPMTAVIFWTGTKWAKGTYVNLFNELRGLRSQLDTRSDEHFEASPYHEECIGKEPVIRAYVISDETCMGDYIDIEHIYPTSTHNAAVASSQNMAVA